MKNFCTGKRFFEAWKLFYKEIKKNHWTKVDFPAKWAIWAVASILLTIWIAAGSGLGIIGILYIYGTIVVFDLYLVCRDDRNSFSVFCKTFSKRIQVKYVYAILISYILILAGITSFVLLVVQFNRAERGWFLIFSSLYVFMMIIMMLFSFVPLIFIRSKRTWKLWCGGSLGICAGIHLAVWQKIKAPDSWMFRRNFTTEENSVLWLLIPAAALILSLLLSYRQACLFYEKQV